MFIKGRDGEGYFLFIKGRDGEGYFLFIKRVETELVISWEIN